MPIEFLTSKFPGHKRPSVDTLRMIEKITPNPGIPYSLYWDCGDNLTVKSEIMGLPKKELKERLALIENRRKQQQKNPERLVITHQEVAELLGVSDARVKELYIFGEILGYSSNGEFVYPADQFPDGSRFRNLNTFIGRLLHAGLNGGTISDWLFGHREELCGFSYAVLAQESSDHYRWVSNKVFALAEEEETNRYLLEKPSNASARNVTPTSVIDSWDTLDIVTALNAPREHDKDWMWVAKRTQCSKNILMARQKMHFWYPKDGAFMSISKKALMEKYGLSEAGVDAVTVQEDTSDSSRVFIETFFREPVDMEDHWDEDAREVGKALKRVHEVYAAHNPESEKEYMGIYERFQALGNVTVLEYAKVSDEHRVALVRFLNRSAEHLEAKNRKAAERKRQEAVMEDYETHMRDAEKAWLEANKDKLNGANRMFPPMMCHPHFM